MKSKDRLLNEVCPEKQWSSHRDDGGGTDGPENQGGRHLVVLYHSDPSTEKAGGHPNI
jgi:hypothetical protein